MKLFDLVAMCVRNLFRRKVRTLLTVTGVVIGTCSILVMVSIGIGLTYSNEQDMANYTDLTAIDVYASDSGMMMEEGSQSDQGGKTAKLDDHALTAMEGLEHVVAVTPVMQLSGSFQIACGDYTGWAELVALDTSKLEMFGYEVTDGRLTTENDDPAAALFGAETAYSFGNPDTGEYPNYDYDEKGNIVGQAFVDPMNDKFTVAALKDVYGEDGMMLSQETGTEHELAITGLMKGDYAKSGSVYGIVISLELAEQLLRESNDLNGTGGQTGAYSSFKVKVDDADNVAAVEETIKAQGYQTNSATAFREAMAKQARMIQLVLGGLGAIAMLVAALGITNTMIMSIYERTREIGVMKVLGCRLRDIRLMFLIEAGGIGFIGGVIGIIFSYRLSFILNIVAGSLFGGEEASVTLSIIPFWLDLLGMAFAVGVGLLAGFYPANRAVNISALSAIRTE